MSKKIMFLITFIVLSISNNFQAMFSAFTAGIVNERDQTDESCCCSCTNLLTALFLTMFESKKHQQQQMDSLFNNQTRIGQRNETVLPPLRDEIKKMN